MDEPVKPQGIRKPLEPDFDPGKELWERIVDDIIEKGSPCMDTVAELVEEACLLPPDLKKKPEQDPGE